jgi:hypothetical protein
MAIGYALHALAAPRELKGAEQQRALLLSLFHRELEIRESI